MRIPINSPKLVATPSSLSAILQDCVCNRSRTTLSAINKGIATQTLRSSCKAVPHPTFETTIANKAIPPTTSKLSILFFTAVFPAVPYQQNFLTQTNAFGLYSKYSMVRLVVPKRRASVTLSVVTGNQNAPFFSYVWTKCTCLVQNDGFFAGFPSARTRA